ncbi:class I SAM-dependent methyltransferase [Nonomuraea guangzhouensis]|uniref:Class I SAM-dependent methyltransferase n=1 Tax=Nonomuraea guangzhouensis TaxID=1291555 RepID=A0ABW4G6L0_9ACTN|nr:class I SAM-dependent methyltransferase [Nonomuraea guangzhouensis]
MAESRRRALPVDYDDDPGRFAANRLATPRDIHPLVSARMAAERVRPVLDVGGGTGVLGRLLADAGVPTVVLDAAAHVVQAPRPAVRADALALPFTDGVFGGAAALWMLYHFADPARVLTEVRRVLRPGGLLAVSAPSRHNDPELSSVLPEWGRPLSFDAELAPAVVGEVLDVVAVTSWDEPLLHLPDREAVTLYLRGRGLTEPAARAAALRVATPLRVTKRGSLIWARRQ